MSYTAPINQIAHTLARIARLDEIAATGAFPNYDPELVAPILDEAGWTDPIDQSVVLVDGQGAHVLGQKTSHLRGLLDRPMGLARGVDDPVLKTRGELVRAGGNDGGEVREAAVRHWKWRAFLFQFGGNSHCWHWRGRY